MFTHHFSQMCTRVMALDLCQNFVSAQYLENNLIEFYQMFFYGFILTRPTVGLVHLIFRIFAPELWPLI